MLLTGLMMLVLGLLLTGAAGVALRPARGVHRPGAPARPAPVRGRHEGPVKPGWAELQLVPTPARHESGAHLVLKEAA